jgi:MFS transporter, SP family, ERD6-like sugar transporter
MNGNSWKNHLFQARFGRPGAFMAALQKLRGKGTDISEEAKEIKVPKKKTVDLLMFYCKLSFFRAIYSKLLLNPFVQDFTEKLQCLPKSKMLDLFQKDYIHAVTVSILNMSCIEGKCFCCFLKNQFRGQVGVGLMALQQFGGVNGICFYASEIFVSAGIEL